MNPITRTLSGVALGASLLATPHLHGSETRAALPDEGVTVSAVRALSEDDLKSFYMHCDRSAAQASPGASDAALCSIAYELVLQRAFGGDFFALLQWWRSARERPLEASFITPSALK